MAHTGRGEFQQNVEGMAEFPDGFDLAALLAPISAGADLREDSSPQSPYFRLRDARAEARAAEHAAETGDGEGGAPADWRTIRELAIDALSTRTKDLEIAAWLSGGIAAARRPRRSCGRLPASGRDRREFLGRFLAGRAQFEPRATARSASYSRAAG
jgi:ImpA, N-terminal, type VI secretion system